MQQCKSAQIYHYCIDLLSIANSFSLLSSILGSCDAFWAHNGFCCKFPVSLRTWKEYKTVQRFRLEISIVDSGLILDSDV